MSKILFKSSAPSLYGEPMNFVLIFGRIWVAWSSVRFRVVIDLV